MWPKTANENLDFKIDTILSEENVSRDMTQPYPLYLFPQRKVDDDRLNHLNKIIKDRIKRFVIFSDSSWNDPRAPPTPT